MPSSLGPGGLVVLKPFCLSRSFLCIFIDKIREKANNENLNAQGCSLEARVVDGFCVEAFVLEWVDVCSFLSIKIDKNGAMQHSLLKLSCLMPSSIGLGGLVVLKPLCLSRSIFVSSYR